jgi:hypothetical protein
VLEEIKKKIRESRPLFSLVEEWFDRSVNREFEEYQKATVGTKALTLQAMQENEIHGKPFPPFLLSYPPQ